MRTSNIRDYAETIYGVDVNEFSEDILYKIRIDKLFEIFKHNYYKDDRLHKIISSRILNENIDRISYIYYIPENIIKQYTDILSEYNKYIRVNYASINKTNTFSRARVIRWNLLDDKNKINEIVRFSNGKVSSVGSSNIDFEWLYEKYPCADIIIESIFDSFDKHEISPSVMGEIIKKIPERKMEYAMKRMFKNKNKYKSLYAWAIENKNIPKKYIGKALRAICKRKEFVDIAVPLTKDILEELPSITRLNLLEKLIYDNNKSIVKLKNEDELRALLFSSIIKYPKRVECVVSKFKYLWRE